MRLVQGDITELAVDAIVNAANRLMLGGLGVDGAIHRAAGPELVRACLEIPEVAPAIRCPTGEARITPGFRLPARFVIHTVGPIWHGGGVREPELLASCYRNSLRLARENDCRTVAFPAISCGVYGYPPEQGCEIAVREIAGLLERDSSFEEITLVAFDSDMHRVFQSAIAARR
jgi:O-acetyl-ADP-ribose deacetylase (regulator of RNase III)